MNVKRAPRAGLEEMAMLDYDELRRSSAMAEEREKELEAKTAVPLSKRLGGLTPPQRFILALMLFLNVLVLGFLCLIATNAIYLPF
jgi:hypothetical protein